MVGYSAETFLSCLLASALKLNIRFSAEIEFRQLISAKNWAEHSALTAYFGQNIRCFSGYISVSVETIKAVSLVH